MEVLNLATQEKQDEILSNFPISGGTDIFQGTFVSGETATSHQRHTLIDVTGKGIITAIWHVGGGATLIIRIQTDEGIIYEVNIGTGTSQSKPFLIPFSKKVKVSANMEAGNAGVNYLLF